ncbi:RidA family protein [Paenibacillus sp. IITD108]|uniref:RidA family protein n=1 Tax=Paenibacillus sp. IITD108 TaxID=3116649 RepID=UPI002F41EE31
MEEKTAVLPFSSATKTDGLLFVSGQGGLDPATGKVVGASLEEQTAQTMDNIKTILAEHGLSFSHVKKVNIYLSQRGLYSAFNELYAHYFQAPYPARTTVYCDLNYDLLVEIDVIASLK